MAMFATVIARTGHVEAIRTRLVGSSRIMPLRALVIPEASTEEDAIELATEEFTQDAARLDLDFFEPEQVSAYEIFDGEEVIGWSVDA